MKRGSCWWKNQVEIFGHIQEPDRASIVPKNEENADIRLK